MTKDEEDGLFLIFPNPVDAQLTFIFSLCYIELNCIVGLSFLALNPVPSIEE